LEVVVLVVTGPSAEALPLRQYTSPSEPVIRYCHSKTPELPEESDDMTAGVGPETIASAAPPPHPVSVDGAMFTRADAPLLITVMFTVTSCPLMTLDGTRASDAVKSPMSTVFESALTDFAVPALLVALAVKYTEPVMSALYVQIIVLVSSTASEKAVRL
jgi:hypothetical protein